MSLFRFGTTSFPGLIPEALGTRLVLPPNCRRALFEDEQAFSFFYKQGRRNRLGWFSQVHKHTHTSKKHKKNELACLVLAVFSTKHNHKHISWQETRVVLVFLCLCRYAYTYVEWKQHKTIKWVCLFLCRCCSHLRLCLCFCACENQSLKRSPSNQMDTDVNRRTKQ